MEASVVQPRMHFAGASFELCARLHVAHIDDGEAVETLPAVELEGVAQDAIRQIWVGASHHHVELAARRDAQAWVQRSPGLTHQDETLLVRRLNLAHGQWLGLGNVG